MAEKDAEIDRLKAEADMADGYADALIQQAKSQAYREFADGLKQISKEVIVPYIADTSIQEHKTGMFWYTAEGFDNLVKELTEKNDKG